MTSTPSNDHAAPETEAEIRQRIAEEIEEQMESWIHSRAWFPTRFREATVIDGLQEALRIIERGAATEGQG